MWGSKIVGCWDVWGSVRVQGLGLGIVGLRIGGFRASGV